MEVDGTSEEQSPLCNGEANHQIPKKKEEEEKEGSFLLGPPTFVDMGNGRFRCQETGHELPAKERDTYGRSKACRLALIDAAISNKKPPLNMFQPSPLSKSKLVCKLTGDTINKSEEHIWKHISGKRFQNKLEQKEVEKLASAEKIEKASKKSRKLPKTSTTAVTDEQKSEADGYAALEGKTMENSSESEEPDYWIPPVGDRWDFDYGNDRWESCTASEQETYEEDGLDEADEQHVVESMELSMRTKRMSIAVGPSSFASRKKKIKKVSATHANGSCDK